VIRDSATLVTCLEQERSPRCSTTPHGAAWLSQLSDELGIDLATLLEALRPGVTAAVEQAMRTRERTLGSIDAIVRLSRPYRGIGPVPHAVLEQARRQAVLRTDLLSQGAFTYRALAEGRQTSEATARQFVRRRASASCSSPSSTMVRPSSRPF